LHVVCDPPQLTGSIEAVRRLRSLRNLLLDSNGFSGGLSLDSAFAGTFPNLTLISVRDNQFSSELRYLLAPTAPELSFPLLTYLDISGNPFPQSLLPKFIGLDSDRTFFLDTTGVTFDCPLPQQGVNLLVSTTRAA
jgi:hypothetical protein